MDTLNEALMNPDFLGLGMGGTNMMSMLWTVAMGRRAVGVEMRGDPFLGVHWNIREDFYHQLGLIDQMMLERYGEEGVPRRGDGRIFRLAECFYSPYTVSGDIVADEIIDGFDSDQHIVGTIHDVEFIDDRWRDGLPNRVITVLAPPKPPDEPDPRKIRTNMVDVLDGPSTFQAEAASIQKLLRRYLELIEQIDRDNNRVPRVQLFTHHRVLPAEGEGFIRHPDGRLQIRIESLKEFDFKGQFVRVREPGSEIIDLGIPALFMIAQGFNSTDAKRLGFEQHDVEYDHEDGRGLVVAQADFLAGLVEVLVGGRLRRRISSTFDKDGNEFWVRQIAVGHENDPEVGWVLVQVPDFLTLDPIEAGLIPEGTDPNSPEYFASYQTLIYDYYIKQASEVLEIPRQELMKVQMIYGPTLFSLVERVGDDALVAANGVVAGDSFGNGHFLTSGGAMAGMVGHSARVLEYWRSIDEGTSPSDAIRRLADKIKEDSHGWLEVSAKEYSQAAPINFGAERIEQISKASGIATSARANAIDSARRQRHALIPLDPSNWRRLFVRNGRVLSALPELEEDHPLQRPEREASMIAVLKSLPVMQKRINAQLDLDQELPEGDKTLIRSMFKVDEAQPVGEKSALSSKISIGPVTNESATVYAFLDIQQEGQEVKRIAIREDEVVVGRVDPKRGIIPDIDLTPFDTSSSVSRQHAKIRLDHNTFFIEDLESRNKTRLGELTLTPHKPEALHHGDVVGFGLVKATFRLLGTSSLPDPWSQS